MTDEALVEPTVAVAAAAQSILLVGAEPGERELVRSAVRRAPRPYDVRAVPTGRALLDYLFHCGEFAGAEAPPPPGLVLCDRMLPDASAQELLVTVRHDPVTATIPIVVLVGRHDPHDVQSLYRCGANSVVIKPPYLDAHVELIRDLERYWFRLAVR
jgi:CheY-like chemotaxis protein